MAKRNVPSQIKVDLPESATQTEKSSRSVAEIQQEFTAICARAGHLEYQVFTYRKDLEILNNQMRELNFEAAAVQAQELKAKQEEATKNE